MAVRFGWRSLLFARVSGIDGWVAVAITLDPAAFGAGIEAAAPTGLQGSLARISTAFSPFATD